MQRRSARSEWAGGDLVRGLLLVAAAWCASACATTLADRDLRCSGVVQARTFACDAPLRVIISPLKDESAADSHLGFAFAEIALQRLWGLPRATPMAMPEMCSELNLSPAAIERMSEADIAAAARMLDADVWFFGSHSVTAAGSSVRLYALVPRKGKVEVLVGQYPAGGLAEMLSDSVSAMAGALGGRGELEPLGVPRVSAPADVETYTALAQGVFEWYTAGRIRDAEVGEDYWSHVDSAISRLAPLCTDSLAVPEACDELGYAYIENIELTRAHRAFERALAFWPRFPDALMGQALISFRNADRETTLHFANATIEANPSVALNRMHLAEFLFLFGETDKAIGIAEKLQSESPDFVTPYLKLADFYYDRAVKQHKSGKELSRESITVLGKGLARRTDSADLYARRANYFEAAGEPGNAVADAERALALAPLHMGALAVLYRQDADKAWARLDAGLKRAGQEPKRDLYRGRILAAASSPVDAADAFRTYLRTHPEDLDAWIGLGETLLAGWRQTGQQDLVEEARAIIDELRPSPSNLIRSKADKLYANYVVVLRDLDELKKVCGVFEKRGVYRLDCLFMQAYLLDVQGSREGYARLHEALKLDPNLSTLFNDDFFTWDIKAAYYLFGWINESRGLLNLAYLQWSAILSQRMADDYELTIAIYDHLQKVRERMEELSRFIVYDRSNSVYIYDFLAKTERRLVTGTYPMWSPDKTKVMYMTSNPPALHMVNVDGTDPVTICPDLNANGTTSADTASFADVMNREGSGLGWSEDGSRVVFCRDFKPQGPGLKVCQRDVHPLFTRMAVFPEEEKSVKVAVDTFNEDSSCVGFSVKANDREMMRYDCNNYIDSGWKISRDGLYLLYGQEGAIVFREIATGKEIMRLSNSDMPQVDLPTVTMSGYVDSQGEPQVTDTRESSTRYPLMKIGKFTSWGYNDLTYVFDVLVIDADKTKENMKEDTQVNSYSRKFTVKRWIEPIYSPGILVLSPKYEQFDLIPEGGQHAMWMPYSWYGIQVEQALLNVRDAAQELLVMMAGEVAKEKRAFRVKARYRIAADPEAAAAVRAGLEEGLQLMRTGDCGTALAKFQALSATHPDHPGPYVLSAVARLCQIQGEQVAAAELSEILALIRKANDCYPDASYYLLDALVTRSWGMPTLNYAQSMLGQSLTDMLIAVMLLPDDPAEQQRILDALSVAIEAIDGKAAEQDQRTAVPVLGLKLFHAAPIVEFALSVNLLPE